MKEWGGWRIASSDEVAAGVEDDELLSVESSECPVRPRLALCQSFAP